MPSFVNNMSNFRYYFDNSDIFCRKQTYTYLAWNYMRPDLMQKRTEMNPNAQRAFRRDVTKYTDVTDNLHNTVNIILAA